MGNPYETPQALAQYLAFHYLEPATLLEGLSGAGPLEGFPSRLLADYLDTNSLGPGARALDLGCAVGRCSLELSRHCAEVVALDSSLAFLEAARTLVAQGWLEFDLPTEGELSRRMTASLPEGTRPDRVRFLQGDALAPPPGPFEVVLAANLLCRLSSPADLLARLPELIPVGGQLILATPCSWMETFTPRERWLGGRVEGPRCTQASLQERLGAHFRLEKAGDLAMLLPEHGRKFQLIFPRVSRWRRQ